MTIAQHHERFDGSGYPRGLAGDDVHVHGQIAAIAESYTSMCRSGEGGGDQLDPHKAFRVIVQAGGRLFRQDIVDAFRSSIAPYGAGSTVQLSDGRAAVVVSTAPEFPLEPVVRITHDRDGLEFDPPVEVNLHDSGVGIDRGLDSLPSDGMALR